MENYMEQRELHETLNNLLWEYSMKHDGDKIDWLNKDQSKFHIVYDASYKKAKSGSWIVDFNSYCMSVGAVYFATREIARAAINEIVFPFIKEHQNFKMIMNAEKF